MTGWLGSQTSGVGGGTGVQNEGYLYDLMGNVTQRQNNASSLTENFYYDNLYRLDYSTLKVGAGAPTTNLDLAYDATGNITSKSDVGAYDYTTPQSGCSYYANNQKHAVRLAGSTVYCYDANGNMVRRGVAANTISWTSYNYPSTINSGTETVSFLYGPERQRWRTQLTSGGVTETTYHVGREFQKVQTASTDYRHYIIAGNRSVAIVSRLSTGTNTLRYVLEDHQGSATNLLSSTGTSIVKENFSAFGNRRNPTTWSGAPTAADLTAINGITREGYTWQTALGAMGLNHMNGRVQDSVSGRFISPDPNIPDPMNTGDYNRYAYVNSNPMTFTDPSGFYDLPEVSVYGSRPGFDWGSMAGMAQQVGWGSYSPYDWFGTGGGMPAEMLDELIVTANSCAVDPSQWDCPAAAVAQPAPAFNWTTFIPGWDLGTCIYNAYTDFVYGGNDRCSLGDAAWAVVGAFGVPELKVLQTGGRTLTAYTIKLLNEFGGTSHAPEAFQRAIESLKGGLSLPNDFRGIIRSNGDYVNPDNGDILGNILDYLP